MAIDSPVDICNLALGHLGEAPIASLDETNAGARACALHYSPTRDEVLRSHRWNFAIQREILTELEAVPLFGFAHQYTLPADCLRVVEFNDSDEGDWISSPFAIEDGKLLTDDSEARVVYIRREEDVSKYDPLFCKALAAKLAVELSESIRGSSGKTGDLLALYQNVTAPLARRVDANEGRRRKGTLPLNSQFVRARYAGR